MLSEGQILEQKYRISRLLGRGGMGSVFEAEHLRIKRSVAIKVLHKEMCDADNVKRFEREAEAAGRIGSDHIVEVLDFGATPDGDRFMVMELMNGEPFKARLAGGPQRPEQLIPIMTQVLDGLAAAHAAGIVHRDLKPDNIFVLREKAGKKDFVKILDFGISKFGSLTAESGGMTKTGTVMGTPFYMSPEQARSANEVDARSDLYSLGVVMYEAVTGVKPFSGTTLTELIFKIAFEDPPDPRKFVPTLDMGFAAIVLRAMARDADARYASAQELKSALSAWRPGAPVGAAPPARNRTVEMMALPAAQPPVAAAAQPLPTHGGTLLVSTQSGAVSAPTLDTVQTWNQPSRDVPVAPPKAKSRGLLIGVFALLAVGGLAAGLFIALRPPTSATAQSTSTASATTAPPPPTSATASAAAAADSAVTKATDSQPTQPLASSAVASAPPPSSATTPASVAATGRPSASARPTGKTTPTGVSTVGDLGY
ncbi:MAG: protein kinase [Polyangiaceae bacterium]